MTKETDARGNYTSYSYDIGGNIVTKTNRRKYSTTCEYDPLNRKTKETDAKGNSTDFTYNENGYIKTIKNGRNYTTTYYYDELNRLIKVEDALSNNITYVYDENGNTKTQTDPNGNTITYSYDYHNKLIKVEDALSHEMTFRYDANGNKVNETDANGNMTIYAYDALNRLISTTDANNNVTTYTYNAVGRLLNVTDARGYTTKHEYDTLGRLSKIIYPSGNETRYSYDSLGNMIEREDAKGLSAYYSYDELNRIIEIKYPDNNTITYDYDAEDNPTKVINNAGFRETTEYTYDKVDYITSLKVDYGTFTKYVNYTYDEVGNRKSMVDSEGNTTYYTYDAENRLINITVSGQSAILFTYDNAGRRTRLDYPSGAYTTYSYDNTDRVTTIWHKKSGGATIAVYNYTYDNFGNILNFTENNVNYTLYTYDDVYRLTNVSYSDGDWSAYTYDGVGNRLTMKTASRTTSYTYDDDNRILTTGSISYKHDENGNLINMTDGVNITIYTYDYENRLIQVILPNSSIIKYQYSALGFRLNKTIYNESILYIYDGFNILSEMTQSGEILADYVYGVRIDEPIVMVRSGTSYYYHSDILGSIKLITNTTEEMVTTYKYDAFGSILLENDSIINQFKFTGREWDSQADLYFYRARYYSANIGRFLQKDPKGMIDGPNLYTYVSNNPVNRIDPKGTEGHPACTALQLTCMSIAYTAFINCVLPPGEPWYFPGTKPILDVHRVIHEDPELIALIIIIILIPGPLDDIVSGPIIAGGVAGAAGASVSVGSVAAEDLLDNSRVGDCLKILKESLKSCNKVEECCNKIMDPETGLTVKIDCAFYILMTMSKLLILAGIM